MKSAIYLNEGNTQLVVTPENEWEKQILRMIHDAFADKTYWGEFYACQGGWIRQSPYSFSGERRSEDSLIFRLEKTAKIPESEVEQKNGHRRKE